MSLDSLEILLYFTLILFSLAFTWLVFSIIFECLGFQNQSTDDVELSDDIELGETSDTIITHQINVVPAISETLFSINPGPKTLISSAAAAAHECGICLEDFQEKEVCWVLFKCNHIFHKPCVEEWLKINFSCPLCRIDAFSIVIDA
ncbi:hypothetical protein REPUB_Repub05bG0062300 [Reevesia pubescens]